jgi:hypothetical protein
LEIHELNFNFNRANLKLEELVPNLLA